MSHNSFPRIYKVIVAVLFFLIALTPFVYAGQKTKLKGRVLAVSFWPITKDMMHGNLRIQEFIFGVEKKDSSGNEVILPIFIANHFYPWDEESLIPEDFFDYSKKYELTVTNENFNYPFKAVAYVQFVSEGVPVLPAGSDSPWPRLEILGGVPDNVLNMDMNIMLPYYKLATTKYKIIKEK